MSSFSPSRVAVAIVVVLLVGIGGPALGLRLAGESTRHTALGQVTLEVSPAIPGRVDLYIPLADWGVRARAIDTPLKLAAEPRTLDRQALIAVVDGDREVLEAARDDLRDAAVHALIRAALYGLGGAIVVAAIALLVASRLLPVQRAWLIRLGAVSLGVALLVCVGVVLGTMRTFDADEFDDPELYARGAELMQLLQVAEKGQQAVAGYESSVERSVGGLAGILSSAGSLAEVPDTASLVLASDLHGNALVLGPLRSLFAAAPVVFAGDFGHTGSAAEADALVPRINRLGSPVVAVSGNHDSSLFMRRLAGAGVVVLTRTGRLEPGGGTDGDPVVDVAGFQMAGLEDPLEWRGPRPQDPERVFSFAERPDGDAEFARAEQDAIDWFERLPERPDVVVIHQNGIAQALARHLAAAANPQPIVILTGHDHQQHIDRYEGGVVVVDGGTVGAGGLLAAGQEFVGLAEVHFRGRPRLLRSVDLINFNPVSGGAEAERAIVEEDDACDREAVLCHDRGE
jgi:predicted phosphodiesterase